jgi:hypothetical protein
MDLGLATLGAAVIGGLGYIIQAVVGLRRENRKDHARVAYKLENVDDSVCRVERKIERVEEKVDGHIVDHAKGAV